MDLHKNKLLEKTALEDLLNKKLNVIGDKAMDVREKAQGRLEGLRQLLDLFISTAFSAGQAKGYADSLEQLTNEVRNHLAAIDEKYQRLEQESKKHGSTTKTKKSTKTQTSKCRSCKKTK